MRLGQIRWNNNVTAAIFEKDGMVRPIPDYTVYDLIRLAEMENASLTKVATRLAIAHKEAALPIIPIHPREVWAWPWLGEQRLASEHAVIQNSMMNLSGFPWVRERLENGTLRIHGWHFDFEHGLLTCHDAESGEWVSVK